MCNYVAYNRFYKLRFLHLYKEYIHTCFLVIVYFVINYFYLFSRRFAVTFCDDDDNDVFSTDILKLLIKWFTAILDMYTFIC